MIYWYTIGDVQFDVREMRQLARAHKYAAFKDHYAADDDHLNPLRGLNLVANQLEKILQRVESHWDLFDSPPPRFVEASKRTDWVAVDADSDLPF